MLMPDSDSLQARLRTELASLPGGWRALGTAFLVSNAGQALLELKRDGEALASAGATPEEVDYLNAHGTSTPMNDRSEAAAAHAVFGARVKQVAVSSTKSVMGHLIAAAGAVEAAVCALAIHHERLPVNANLREPDPDCDLDIVREAPRERRVRLAMSNSLGSETAPGPGRSATPSISGLKVGGMQNVLTSVPRCGL